MMNYNVFPSSLVLLSGESRVFVALAKFHVLPNIHETSQQTKKTREMWKTQHFYWRDGAYRDDIF